MSTVAELLTWASSETALRSYCNASETDFPDAVLQLWFDTAVETADDFLGIDFDSCPSKVKLGVYEYVKAFVDTHGSAIGIKSQKIGDIAETYGSSLEMARIAMARAKAFWSLALVEVYRLG